MICILHICSICLTRSNFNQRQERYICLVHFSIPLRRTWLLTRYLRSIGTIIKNLIYLIVGWRMYILLCFSISFERLYIYI